MDRENRKKLGQRVRKYREARGWNHSQLAKEAGISRSYIYQLESGESSPTEEKLTALAKALGVSVPDLLGAGEELPFSDSLKEFAQEDNIPIDDVRMLARVNYRGAQPKTVEAWRILYSVIKAASQEER